MKEKTTTKALGSCFRCCQTNKPLLDSLAFSLSIKEEGKSLKIEPRATLMHETLYGDNVVELVFGFDLLIDSEVLENLDSKKVAENLEKCRWSKCHVSLARKGIEKFKELYKKPEEIMKVLKGVEQPYPLKIPGYLLS